MEASKNISAFAVHFSLKLSEIYSFCNPHISTSWCRLGKKFIFPSWLDCQNSFPAVPTLLTQGRLVKDAGDVHLYSGIFSVIEKTEGKKEGKKEEEKKTKEKKERKGEILALLPHFLSFPALTNTG